MISSIYFLLVINMFSHLSLLNFTTVVLTLGVIFVNGLTDAPNSVATSVTTRCISLRKAVILSGIFNFIGCLCMSKINNSVTETVLNMVSFGSNETTASVALSAALFSIVLWAVVAWYFGIPTSESHALIAGLTGSSIALSNGISSINFGEWAKAIYGLFTSCFGGFVLGFLLTKLTLTLFRNVKRKHTEEIFKASEIFASLFMSFMHGAQDGQKFIAVLILAFGLNSRSSSPESTTILTVISALVMALGTITGGKKIIKSIGLDMVKLQKYQGFSADLAGAVSLLLSTVFGLPVSTTHAKTTAMMGAGFSKSKRSVNPNIIKDIAFTWLLTFPGCGTLGYFVTKLFLLIF